MSYDITLYGSNAASEAIVLEEQFDHAIEAALEQDPDADQDPVVELTVAGWALPLQLDEIEAAYGDYELRLPDRVRERIGKVRVALSTALAGSQPLSKLHGRGLLAVMRGLRDGLVLFNDYPFAVMEDVVEQLERFVRDEPVDSEILPVVY